MSYNYVRDKTIAKELVQDVFVKLWLKRDQVSHIEDPEAYLLRCLRNRIYDHYESAARGRRLGAEAFSESSRKVYTMEEDVVFNEGMSVIDEELEKMPEKTRMIFRMSKFDQYSNDEIASTMHLSGKAVEYHITQAVKKLRVRLALFLS